MRRFIQQIQFVKTHGSATTFRVSGLEAAPTFRTQATSLVTRHHSGGCAGLFSTILLFAGGFLIRASAQGLETDDRSWIDQPVSAELAKFSAEKHPYPKDKNLIAVFCQENAIWWGRMRVFKQNGDRVEWAAAFPKKYIEERGGNVVSCKWLSFRMLENPVLELIESTHMGNGSLWLLELEGKEFRVLLNTPVKGGYWQPAPGFDLPREGKARFEGDHLTVEYRQAKEEKYPTVILSGSVSITDMLERDLPSKPYYQECTWNNEKRAFVSRTPSPGKPAQ